MKPVPGATAPTPQPDAALSPPPPATTTLPVMPQRDASSALSVPVGALPSNSSGICDAVEAGEREHLVRPGALRRGEPQRAGGIRHVARLVAGEQQADIVLRQEHGLAPWRRSPARGACTQISFGAVKPGMAMLPVIALARRADLGGFLGRAPVVPQDAGTEQLVGGVEQRRAVHLAGEADALDRRHLLRVILGQPVEHGLDTPSTSFRGPARTSRDAAARPRGRRCGCRGCADRASMRTAFTDDVPISMPRYMLWRSLPPWCPSSYGTLSRMKMSMRMRSCPAS